MGGFDSARRLLGLAYEAAMSNFGSLECPYKLTFSVTYLCQSRCKTCNIWQIKPRDELGLAEVKEFASKNRGFRWIEITGGEPFLRSDIVEIVRAFWDSSAGLYVVTMPTNSLCNHDMVVGKVRQMLEMGIPKISITVSLDGYRELHDNVRGISGNFDRCIEMFRKLSELKKSYGNLFLVFGYTMSKYNQGELEKTFNEVKKEIPWITHNDFHINMGQISDSYYRNGSIDLSPDRESAAAEIKEFVSRRNFQPGMIPIIEGIFLKKLSEYVRTARQPMKSKSLDASLFLDSYGNVYPSIMWSRKIGNIRETGYSLGEIWKNSEAEEVRKIINEGREPVSWTACEAYQSIVGNVKGII
jgi:MoaA/NifB/PqqE/SkfB family radical SAM enzyme